MLKTKIMENKKKITLTTVNIFVNIVIHVEWFARTNSARNHR